MIALLIVVLTASIFAVIERLRPARKLPFAPGWYARVSLLVGLEMGLLAASRPLLSWAAEFAPLIDLSHLPTPLGGLIAYLIGTLVVYMWHRARHQSNWLWRSFHQLHHSPRRMETLTTFYRHPSGILANTVIGAAVCFGLLGLDIPSAMVYGGLMIGVQLFYHANISTPRWLGYFIQRPEMHRVHHARNYHRNNYGDLAIWDLIFGTWENPRDGNRQVGFEIEKEWRINDMLLARDVHSPKLSKNKPMRR